MNLINLICLRRTSAFMRYLLFVALLILCLQSCKNTEPRSGAAIVPDTSVSIYGPYVAVKLPLTKGVKPSNPIQISLGPRGVLYAANRTGEVYSLRDSDNDGIEDEARLFCNVADAGLSSPSGFAFRGDTIFIGTASQIRAYIDLNHDGKADSSWVFFDDIPVSEHPYEWTSGLNFGPDNWLYVALATDSWNAGASPDPKGYRGAILRISPNGKAAERVATGIRSVYSMRFNNHGDLFFIDNEGGGNPKEELNLLVRNAFYGHNKQKYNIDSVTGPVHAFETEVAPSGIVFNSPENDFGGTGGDLFVSFYGPGERWTRGGIARVRMQRQADGSYSFEEFPLADIPKLSNIAFGSDGSLYLAQHGRSDYWYNAVYENEGAFYKLIFDPRATVKSVDTRATPTKTFSESAVEAGKQLFAEYACLGCHAVDGETELLGPNLKDAGKRFSREELLTEILDPSAIIKPSMMAVRVFRKDGQVLLGRVINASEKELSMMLVGNHVVTVPRDQIVRTENEKKSLMYEGLLNRMPEEQREALLDYISSLSE
jgi:putative heme-binding domain-containing protein